MTTTTHTYSAMESLLQASHMYTSNLKQQQSAAGPHTCSQQQEQQQQQMQHLHYQQMLQLQQQQHQAQQQLHIDQQLHIQQQQHQQHVSDTQQEENQMNLPAQNESQMFYQSKSNMAGIRVGSSVSDDLYLHHHQQQQQHHQQSCENSQELQVSKVQQHDNESQSAVCGNNIDIHQHHHLNQDQQQQQSILPNREGADASTLSSNSVWCQQQQHHGRDISDNSVAGTHSKGLKQSGLGSMATTASSNHLVTSLRSSQPFSSVSNHADVNNTEQASLDPSNTEQRNTEPAEGTGHSPSYPQSSDVEPLPLPTFFDNQNCVFCVDCNKVFASGCRVHRTDYVYQSDSPVLSRARASLPQCFMLQKTGTNQAVDLLGVWCKGCLSERAIFGPMVGERVEMTNQSFAAQELGFHPFLISQNESSKLVLHLVDEAVCNWTMFIQLAPTLLEQNCTVYRDNGNFFIVTKTEIKDEELLLWFSAELCLELGITQNPGNHPFHQCSECGLNFLVKRFLNAHQKTKHSEKYSYTTDCYMCKKKFKNRKNLSKHLATHMYEKPHCCQYCNKQFADASNLKQHLHIHTGEKKFACDLCGKQFRQKAHLDSHQIVHTEERQFQCPYCDTAFGRQSDLKVHTYKHTKEVLYRCNRCDKEFFKLQNYQKHMKVHTGERNYMCNKCFKGFQTKYHRDRHMRVCRVKNEKEDGYMSLAEVVKLGSTGDAVPLKTVSVEHGMLE